MKDKLDQKRRNFLKILAFGGGAAVLGRLFGPGLLDMFYPKVTKDFQQFRVTETRRKFSISTKDGEEIFVMDDEK